MKTPFTKMTLNGENMIIIPERLYNGMENEIHDLRETLSKMASQTYNLRSDYLIQYVRDKAKEQFQKDYR